MHENGPETRKVADLGNLTDSVFLVLLHILREKKKIYFCKSFQSKKSSIISMVLILDGNKIGVTKDY